jgi:hypothetical protein
LKLENLDLFDPIAQEQHRLHPTTIHIQKTRKIQINVQRHLSACFLVAEAECAFSPRKMGAGPNYCETERCRKKRGATGNLGGPAKKNDEH